MLLAILYVVVLAQLSGGTPVPGRARGPAFSRDGRLAISVDGDLWIRSAAPAEGGRWRQLTSGAAWDRDAAWSPDGRSIVFSSDRAGAFDIWRLDVPDDAARREPVRLTSDPEDDGEPTVAADSRVIFVRGRGAAARLYVRSADGAERRLTKREGGERTPALSPDFSRVAYVAFGESGRSLRVRWLASDVDSVVVGDRNAEYPAWSPAGDRIAFTVGGQRPGVFVTTPDGRYVNLVSARRSEPAWSADGATIVLAELPAEQPGYNGDPDRVREREASDELGAGGRLWFIPAPPPPDSGVVERLVVGERSRESRNAEAFDRVWSRTAELYYAGSGAGMRRRTWDSLRTVFRPRALAAAADVDLERVLHALLRERPPLRDAVRGRAVVSSAHPLATEAGLEILRKGGNVVDAAVAVSFALGVVEPDASGVGGYGQMLIHRRGMDRPALIEFMSRVPEEATLANASLLQDGRYPADGPVLANVPGTVAGMHAAWKKHGSGRIAWADVVTPAARLAKDGFPVSDGLATTLITEREHFAKYESSRHLFFRDARPLRAGETLKNPDLAWTLEQIAKDGPDAFYKGEIARRMVADLRGKGNAIRLTDLTRYYAADREPVMGTYRGHQVYTSAPPVAGGANLIAQLNLLEQWGAPRPYAEDAPTLHAMIAAWQLAPSSRGRIADPGLWPVTVEPFLSKDTARVRWRCFDPERALTLASFRADTLVCATAKPRTSTSPEQGDADAGGGARLGSVDEPRGDCGTHEHAAEVAECHAAGTTSFAVADAEGNVVSVTQTLGTWGGNFYVSPGLGFLYNDKLTSYGTDPSAYGARLPHARHGSTLAPTIVFRGAGEQRRPLLAVGAAGNAWITSAVYQTLTGILDQGLDPQRALELPRFLPTQRGTGAQRELVVEVEHGIAPDVRRKLKEMGYTLNFISLEGELRMGYGAAIVLGDGVVTAGADPRRAGAAGAVK